jgi:DNA helicase-2/ATP-dependent DNA helicase PcrA
MDNANPSVDSLNELDSFFSSNSHTLVLGGPGSGKTTSALLKAGSEIESGLLAAGQQIAFLSFARATVARVAERALELLPPAAMSRIEINTYHGFAWKLLRSHGYLLNGAASVKLLPPPEAATRLAEIAPEIREEEMRRLFHQDGVLHFDLFASLAAELLTRSKSLKAIICDAYPLLVLDEFQDTNPDEWQLIRVLGEASRLIALADAEQRIYEFRGADPKRIGEFIAAYNPATFDFGAKNHRSNGKDIVSFGNDLLTNAHRNKRYSDVAIIHYRMGRGIALHHVLKSHVLGSVSRLTRQPTADWSLAVLVPAKRLMIEVSDYLATPQSFESGKGFPEIPHEVALDTEAPSLAATLIGRLLDRGINPQATVMAFVQSLIEYLKGRKGSQPPTQAELALCGALAEYVDGRPVRGKNRQRLIVDANAIANAVHNIEHTGDPSNDWLTVRRILADAESPEIKQVAEDARYLRLLNRGAQLRLRLNELWRRTGTYSGAAAAVRDALLQEHFAASTRSWNGIHVMTIHKSKGKEFDEVIIYEGVFRGRIVRSEASEREVEQARLALRVGVTRAIQRVTILTPQGSICPLLQ